MKTKIIAFRTSEELFHQYSSLNIKVRKQFVNKCNEMLTNFLLINVNKSNVNNPNVNKSNVNNPNVNNPSGITSSIKDRLIHTPQPIEFSDEEINELIKGC